MTTLQEHIHERTIEMLKIEKGIPMPERAGNRTGLADTLSAMEVGDSVLLAGKKHVSKGQLYNVVAKTGFKFATRIVDGGLRIWRIS